MLRRALNEEHIVISKQIKRDMVLTVIFMSAFAMLLFVAEFMAICTMIRKASILFSIGSIFVQLFFIFFIWLTISVIIEHIRRDHATKKSAYHVEEVTITKVEKIVFKHTSRFVYYVDQYGEKGTIEVSDKVFKKSKKGVNALIVKYENKKFDDEMVIMAHDIAKRIEEELDYPGQIKVNVIRESRVSDVAK